MTTNTASVPARDIKAGDTMIFRSRIRTVLSVTLDIDENDGEAFIFIVLEAMQGQPLNAYLPPDELVAIVR
jgi:hypothetical protein